MLLLQRQDALARLILDRPAARNALNWAMWRSIPALIREVEKAPEIRLLVIQGAGEIFASGGDIAEMQQLADSADEARRYGEDMMAALQSIAGLRKPTIALLRGACIGGGLALALACDLRFAGRDVKIGMTPARLGLVPPLADVARLVAQIGVAATKDLLFSARLLEGGEALQLGLIDRLTDNEDLATAVDDYAAQICAMSPYTLGAVKAMIRRIEAGQHEDDPASLEAFADALTGDDFREGAAAFLAKRPAQFSDY